MRVAAVIQAKGNSTRVHNKNSRLCGGKKLVEWPIEAALGAKCIDNVFVSTDGATIKEIALSHKGVCVIDRPYQLSQPYSTGAPTQIDMLKQIYDKGYKFDYIFNLWCTSPLVQSWQLDDAFNKFINAYWATQLAAVVNVKGSGISHYCIVNPANNKMMSPYGLQGAPAWHDMMTWVKTTGAFGIYNPNIVDYSKLPEITSNMSYMEIEGMYGLASLLLTAETFSQKAETIYAYAIDNISALDINTEDDLALADHYLTLRKEKQDAGKN